MKIQVFLRLRHQRGQNSEKNMRSGFTTSGSKDPRYDVKEKMDPREKDFCRQFLEIVCDGGEGVCLLNPASNSVVPAQEM